MGKVQQTSMVTVKEIEARADAEYWKEFAEAARILSDSIKLIALASAIPAPILQEQVSSVQEFRQDDASDPDYADYRASHPFAADGRPTCPSKQGKWQPPFPER